jgi:glycosyltransferase involved in cell wall biosynthesis
MHILEIPSFFPPYGGLFCLDQAKALKALGHEVRILSNVQLGATIGLRDYVVRPYLRYEHVMDGITVCQSYQRGLPGVIRFNVNRWVNIVCSMFDDYVKKYGKPDVLHAHCAKWAGYAAMQIAQAHGMPYVITEHFPLMLLEAEFGPAPSKAWQIPLLKEAYRKASMVLPVSQELVDSTACYYGHDYRWQYLSNTIDTDYFTYQPRPSREGRPFRFCCLADNSFRKGYDVLIKAFQMLHEQHSDAELHLAGRDTDTKAFRAQLSSGMKAHGLLDKAGVRQLLYECDALVLASRSEVQPLVLLEAMSTGIPVIATDCIPQCLRIEGGCSIVPVDDAAALSQAMVQVMTGPEVDGEKLSEQVKALASPQVVGMCLQTIFGEAIVSH